MLRLKTGDELDNAQPSTLNDSVTLSSQHKCSIFWERTLQQTELFVYANGEKGQRYGLCRWKLDPTGTIASVTNSVHVWI